MLKFIRIILATVLVLFVVNCTQTQEDKKDTTVNDHSHSIGQSEGDLPIDPVASKVAEFSMEGKYQDAINVLVAAKDVSGYQWDKEKIYESLIYLYDKTKQYEKNLDVWRNGHSKGIVFRMDKTKKHFKPYLTLDGFDDIYEKDLELQKEIEKTK